MNDVKQILLDLRLDGWSLIENVIPQDRVEEIRERILQVVAEQSPNYRTAPGNIGFVPGVINHDQSFAAYLADRRLTGVAEALFGPHFRISFTSAIINLPGNERGKWHADWPFNQEVAGRIPAPYPDVCQHLTTLWMLAPFTTDSAIDPSLDKTSYGGSVTLNQKIGGDMLLVAILGWEKLKQQYSAAGDVVPTRINDIIYRDNVEQGTAELRLQNATPGRFDWVVGATAYRDKVRLRSNLDLTDFVLSVLSADYIQRRRSVAGFADGSVVLSS